MRLIPLPFSRISLTLFVGGGEPVDLPIHQPQTMKDDLGLASAASTPRWLEPSERAQAAGIPARSGQPASLNFTGFFDACGAVSLISEPFR